MGYRFIIFSKNGSEVEATLNFLKYIFKSAWLHMYSTTQEQNKSFDSNGRFRKLCLIRDTNNFDKSPDSYIYFKLYLAGKFTHIISKRTK